MQKGGPTSCWPSFFVLDSVGWGEADQLLFPLPAQAQGRQIPQAESLATVQQQILDTLAGFDGADLVIPLVAIAAGESHRQLPAGGNFKPVVEIAADGLVIRMIGAKRSFGSGSTAGGQPSSLASHFETQFAARRYACHQALGGRVNASPRLR